MTIENAIHLIHILAFFGLNLNTQYIHAVCLSLSQSIFNRENDTETVAGMLVWLIEHLKRAKPTIP